VIPARPVRRAAACLALAGLAVLGVSGCGGGPRRGPGAGAPAASSAWTSLAGLVVAIDPGHNGGNAAAPEMIDRQVDAGGIHKDCDTVGAATDAGYPEHAFTFDVSVRLAALLTQRGARVVMTRVDDTGIGPCVDERARLANLAGADAAVSIHADGGPADGVGFHVIEPGESPDHGNQAILAPSARLADDLRASFGRATGEPTSNYTADAGLAVREDLGGLNLSRVPKVFIECANMRDALDASRVSDPAWRQRAAVGIADGLAAFLRPPPS
jgi:N-acetylmuramoyl-L-alanine amidase